MMLVKVHRTDNGNLVAICDKELLGKKFIEDGLQLDLTSDFYRGTERSESELAEILGSARIINFVGEESVALGLSRDLIEKKHTIRIGSVPHAQCVIER